MQLREGSVWLEKLATGGEELDTGVGGNSRPEDRTSMGFHVPEQEWKVHILRDKLGASIGTRVEVWR